MTNITITLNAETIKAIAEEVAKINGTAVVEEVAPVKTKAAAKKAAASKTKGKTKVEVEPEEEDEEEDEDEQSERRAELAKMRITSLRKIAKELGFDADEVDAESDKETLIQSILDDEAENADEDEDEEEAEDEDAEEADEDEADDEEDEDGEYTRDDLEGMSLKELKALAKDAGYTAADVKGMDQDGLVDFLLGEGEDEEEEEEEEEEEAEYDEDDLIAMSSKELLALAKEWEVKLTPALRKGATTKAGRKKIAAKMLA